MLKMRRTDENCYSDDDDSDDDHNADKHNPGDQGHWCHVMRLQNVRIVLRIIRGIINPDYSKSTSQLLEGACTLLKILIEFIKNTG